MTWSSIVLTAWLPSLAAAQQCLHPAAAPRLDQVILVVPDLAAAEHRLGTEGFSFTPGHLTPDGLRNEHIRLADGAELALVAVSGLVGDATGQQYADLLAAEGQGGAFVTLSSADLNAAAAQARRLGLAPRQSGSVTETGLAFSPPSPASALLLVQRSKPAGDSDPELGQPNGASGLATVWLEGGDGLDSLLGALRAVPCGRASAPDGRIGVAWGLARGTVVVLRPRVAGRLPRPVGADLMTAPGLELHSAISLPGFWIRFVEKR